MCYAAMDVCLEGVLANSGVYMENGSFLLCSIATDMWLAAKSRIYMIGGWGFGVNSVGCCGGRRLGPCYFSCSGALCDVHFPVLAWRMLHNVPPQMRHLGDSLCLGCLRRLTYHIGVRCLLPAALGLSPCRLVDEFIWEKQRHARLHSFCVGSFKTGTC